MKMDYIAILLTLLTFGLLWAVGWLYVSHYTLRGIDVRPTRNRLLVFGIGAGTLGGSVWLIGSKSSLQSDNVLALGGVLIGLGSVSAAAGVLIAWVELGQAAWRKLRLNKQFMGVSIWLLKVCASIASLYLFFSLFGLLSQVAVWIWPQAKWANEWAYSTVEGLGNATAVISEMPHDCEFLTAPIGSKHCHYDKLVETIRVKVDSRNQRVVSWDEGKTWFVADDDRKPIIFINWAKVSD